MHRVALLLAPAITVALAPPTRVIVEEFAVARRSGAAYGRLGGQPGGAVEFAVVRGRREEDGAPCSGVCAADDAATGAAVAVAARADRAIASHAVWNQLVAPSN